LVRAEKREGKGLAVRREARPLLLMDRVQSTAGT